MVEEILSKEDLNKYDHFLTVGGLKRFLAEHNIPDNAKVLIQRVEDVYYEKHNWAVYLKPGEYSDASLPETMNQYHPAWCCVRYQDDPDILFIDMHY